MSSRHVFLLLNVYFLFLYFTDYNMAFLLKYFRSRFLRRTTGEDGDTDIKSTDPKPEEYFLTHILKKDTGLHRYY
jgi:hypothetical protein